MCIPALDLNAEITSRPALEFSCASVFKDIESGVYMDQVDRVIINGENVVNVMNSVSESRDNKIDDLTGYEVGDAPSLYPTADAVIGMVQQKLGGLTLSVADGILTITYDDGGEM